MSTPVNEDKIIEKEADGKEEKIDLEKEKDAEKDVKLEEVALVDENTENVVKENENKTISDGETCVSSTSPTRTTPSAEKSARDDAPEGTNPVTKLGNGFEIIRIKRRHGQLRKAVPIMPLPLAIILCILNIFFPGIGTLLSAFTVFCCGKTECETKRQGFILNVVAALLQLVTLIIIVGWLWSIAWGIIFVKIAKKEADRIAAENAKVDV
ncbi:hypothetical protein CHUAL_003729 [Chamberlinius hualienensis]